MLDAKPSDNNDPDSGKNRPKDEAHANEIKEYILSRARNKKPWILGTLTANVAKEKIELIKLCREFCLVVIEENVKLDITDGQHRQSAIKKLMDSSESYLIANHKFPITLVLEGDDRQCQTDFRDMAQTKPLDKSLLLSFGEFEGRVGITKNLVEKVAMFHRKTEKIKGTASTQKKLIFTMNYIAKFVGCALANDPQNELKKYDVETCSNSLISSLNNFFDQCELTSNIATKSVEDLTVDEVAEFKENSILGKSVGLEVLGRVMYLAKDYENHNFSSDKISQIAQLDWSMSSELWQGNIVKKDPNPSNPNKLYKITAGASPIKMAVYTAKSQLGWQ